MGSLWELVTQKKTKSPHRWDVGFLRMMTLWRNSYTFNGCFWFPSKVGSVAFFTPQKARTISGIYIYKWYILPIGGLYVTYHLLREPETTIDTLKIFKCAVQFVQIAYLPLKIGHAKNAPFFKEADFLCPPKATSEFLRDELDGKTSKSTWRPNLGSPCHQTLPISIQFLAASQGFSGWWFNHPHLVATLRSLFSGENGHPVIHWSFVHH